MVILRSEYGAYMFSDFKVETDGINGIDEGASQPMKGDLREEQLNKRP
jgi:hypothetical protein